MTKVKTKTLWQIGKSGDGAKEFPKFGNGWHGEYNYTVGSDADPINQPSIPPILVTPGRKQKPKRSGKQLYSTDKLNIRFKVDQDYKKDELTLFYNFFGSETDSLFVDSQKITEIPGVGEGKLKQSKIPLPALSRGEHVLTISTAGGSDGVHWIDYLKLEGVDKVNQIKSAPVLSFDGKKDYIQVDLSPLNPLNPEQFTVSLWAKVTGGQGSYRSTITSRMSEPYGGYMIYAGEDDKWQFWIGNGSSHVKVIGSDVVLNSWTHLSATYDGSEMNFYINGKQVGECKSEFVPNKSCPLRIGAGNTESNPDFFFCGEITEVRIWNQARSSKQIQASMSQRLDYVNNKEKSLVGYWMLNRGAEFTVCDSTVNDQYGIIHGASWITSEDLPIKQATLKEQFVYGENGLAMFDADKVLPAELQATTRWLANFHQSFKGLLGTILYMGIKDKEKTPLPYMPPNLTSLNPDKYSDEFFVERRLNGINPGQLKRVENQDWNYIIKYDFRQIEKVDDFAIFPQVIEARFCLDGKRLNPHSIEYILYGETEKQEYKPVDSEWEQAKKIFRTAELVYHESRCHLGRTHIN
ncbi:MAG: LamG domain-containing protein, partial [Cyanobacteria bacterium J06641_2]